MKRLGMNVVTTMKLLTRAVKSTATHCWDGSGRRKARDSTFLSMALQA